MAVNWKKDWAVGAVSDRRKIKQRLEGVIEILDGYIVPEENV